MATAAACVAAPVQIVVGDWAARIVAVKQPVKLAAFEGLGQVVSGAPEHLLGWYVDGEVRFGIKIPRLLSLLAYHDPDATVRGQGQHGTLNGGSYPASKWGLIGLMSRRPWSWAVIAPPSTPLSRASWTSR